MQLKINHHLSAIPPKKKPAAALRGLTPHMLGGREGEFCPLPPHGVLEAPPRPPTHQHCHQRAPRNRIMLMTMCL